MSQLTLEDYKRIFQHLEIGNAAVHHAQDENRKKGIANWYSINGFIISDQEIEAVAKKRER